MQQFTVPQFIDVEDKIIGPITVRQFIIIIIAGLFLFVEYKLSDFAFFIAVAVPTVTVFGTIAFAKVNGMPFHYFILNVVQTFKKPKLRVWSRQEEIKGGVAKKAAEEVETVSAPVKRPVTRSRLSDLALVIDTGGVYRGEDLGPDVSFNQTKGL